MVSCCRTPNLFGKEVHGGPSLSRAQSVFKNGAKSLLLLYSGTGSFSPVLVHAKAASPRKSGAVR